MTQTTNPANTPQTPTPAPPPPSDEVTLTIDGKSVTAKKGTLLVEAARQVGIEIPVFCYHPKLKPVGACRMCLVQVEKLPRLQTACTTPVGADMVVHTTSKDVVDAQNGVIELLLANHPLDCPICDKGGECPLQDNTFAYGRGVSRFTEEKRHKEKAYPLSDRIVLDRERCIMCYRCVRFHQEIPGDEALAAIDRGGDTEIGTLPGETYDSIFSGNTVELCPVGALTSRQYRFKARPWDLVRTPSVCSGCAVGCNLEVHSRTENVLRLVTRENPDVDGGWLCDAGRFDSVPAPREQRALRPMVRDGGTLRPTTWQEALDRSRALLGAASAVTLASPALSNEAMWLLEQGGTPRGALWPSIGVQGWPVQGAIKNLASAKAIVLVGLDAWNELPVLALWIHKVVAEHGAKLVVIGSANGLFRDTAHWLKAPFGSEAAAATALADVLNGANASDLDGVPASDLAAAAKAVQALEGGVALLAHPRVLEQNGAQATLERLASLIGANGETGLVGAPALAANGRGAQTFAPSFATTNTADLLRSAPGAALLLGDEAWGELDLGNARLVLASSRMPVVDDPRIDVVLPMAHPYERQGTLINLEGRIQHQEGGAAAAPAARADYGIVATLTGDADPHLPVIRRRMADAHPDLADSIIISDALAADAIPGWHQIGAASATSPGQGQMPVTTSPAETGHRGA